MANLPELEDSGEPTIVEMVKQQEISNFYLEQIRDILIKGFNLSAIITLINFITFQLNLYCLNY